MDAQAIIAICEMMLVFIGIIGLVLMRKEGLWLKKCAPFGKQSRGSPL